MAKNTIILKDYTGKISANVEKVALQWLEDTAGELESATKRNSAVGQPGAPTKNSWKHQVDAGKKEAVVGSPLANAVYEEYGTGEYALEGNGRKSPWYVPVEEVVGYKRPTYQGKVIVVYGKGGKKYYKTDGKEPKQMLHRAWDSVTPKAKKRLQSLLKGVSNK